MALGGHHGPAPDWQGVDKVVRGYFPHDYQRTYLLINETKSKKDLLRVLYVENTTAFLEYWWYG